MNNPLKENVKTPSALITVCLGPNLRHINNRLGRRAEWRTESASPTSKCWLQFKCWLHDKKPYLMAVTLESAPQRETRQRRHQGFPEVLTSSLCWKSWNATRRSLSQSQNVARDRAQCRNQTIHHNLFCSWSNPLQFLLPEIMTLCTRKIKTRYMEKGKWSQTVKAFPIIYWSSR